ncbi:MULTISPECIES: SDR family NAD(P)-dependent oxidoreductase [Alphaproteobacteria]|uniref:3-oxoacyl-ACP reductase n=2 Tax=Alphaproteobacteria TaxID=28211 RepID=A0A512HNP5_9HYPH|nr:MULTISPECIES: SDR family oxidoreductase [Alphaproteobacteria]GEO87072.1 3-oxoacyl-ACP reductase [Ciceribacter naphthalenivorans]GLR23142.1 3-oxoacyl-ACP reductase [Ciceribacter naphthalenivorans]GLT05998.1 3-oxoacyl-ACP reductase [Sphingomonas psychrolutea]
MKLQGRTALITGAATGIGRSIAELFQKEGANVVIADIQGAAAAAAEMGGATLGVEANVTSKESMAAAAAAAEEKFGGIDILVNNAGIFTGLNYTPMEAISVDDWRKLMDVNVMGPWICATACLPALRKSANARIVNIASVIAHLGIPMMLHYVSSKGAVAAMTRAMARELAMTTENGVLVNSVSPGYTHSDNAKANTDQHAAFEGVASSMRLIKRSAEPLDIAKTVAFLASDEGGYITGQNIVVDGGIFFSQ